MKRTKSMRARQVTRNDQLIGERVRRARLAAAMSQEELGRAVGVTFQQIQKNEKGINRISAGRLMHMAEVLRQPLSYFYDNIQRDGHVVEPDCITALASTRQGFALANAFIAIDDDDLRGALVEMIEILAGVKRLPVVNVRKGDGHQPVPLS
jgi:transcriptional regulator with XRE-family HTH domain